MASLIQTAFGWMLRAPDGLLVRLSGKPQRTRGERKLLPAFQFLCASLDRAGKPIESLPPVEARAFQDSAPVDLDPLPPNAPPAQDHRVTVDGGEITVRAYAPPGSSGKLPTLVYFHGGGWVLGNLASHHGLCTRLAETSHCRIFSVDYRLAPEYPFPVPLDDCNAAFSWVLENAEELGVDPTRLAAGGDSAGGNLTAALCLTRQQAAQPLPCLQLLIYPVTDFAFDTASYEECASGLFLTRPLMEWFREHYLPNHQDWDDPRAAPLRAPDVSGHPPAILVTAGFDPLCDEGLAYGDKLRQAGVEVEARAHDGFIHGFANMGIIPQARLAIEELGTRLGERLRDVSPR